MWRALSGLQKQSSSLVVNLVCFGWSASVPKDIDLGLLGYASGQELMKDVLIIMSQTRRCDVVWVYSFSTVSRR